MSESHKINYIEMPTRDISATKHFFSAVFDWQFIDYGESYVAIQNAGIDGGFFVSENLMHSDNGSALVVLYSDQLTQTLKMVEAAGGHITKPIFSFPGGRRFHFTCPAGNEFAVWSDPEGSQ